MSSYFKSFCHDQQSQVVSPIFRKHLLHIQQQRYFTPILHDVTMLMCPTCIIHGCDPITSKRNKVGILDNKLSCIKIFIMYVFYNLPTNPVIPIFFGVRLRFRKTHIGVGILHNQSLAYLYSTS